MQRPITVALGRFDELMRRGLTGLLSEDPSVYVIEHGSFGAALGSAGERDTPRVLILDETSVPEPSALKRLRATRPTTGIVVLAVKPTDAYRKRILDAGAVCVCKDGAGSDLLAAVHLAAMTPHPSVDPPSLTACETEVLGCLSLGYSYAETAQALGIGVETVRTHSARIRCELGVRSKRELVVTALRAG